MSQKKPSRIEVHGSGVARQDEVLSQDALWFLTGLVREFGGPIAALLDRRKATQARHDAGELPGFLPETAAIRSAHWKVAPLPEDLQSRVVEITGPVDRKMIINALDSGADVFMADFEDSNAPTWENIIAGQINLRDAVLGTISYRHPETGKLYQLAPAGARKRAVLMVRPRGLHLPEVHLTCDGKPVPAALVDFGLYFFHNAHTLIGKGTGPYFYLPKLESHLEARLWNEVFVHAQHALGLSMGTIKATVLIETLPAAFEMDEILDELRDHVAGLNCGRWDYIFSYIKTFRNRSEFVLPDRSLVTMNQPFMRAYSQLLIKTCHRRGALAMGGMAAQIPIKNDPEANRLALDKVRADKMREAHDGHDGTWVAHPGLIEVARAAFEAVMTGENQLDRLREEVAVTRADLIAPPTGTRTDEGLRHNIRVGIQYLEAWLRGTGCVPLYHLMEDAATAEISRMQIWQWLKHDVALDGGKHHGEPLTQDRVRETITEEMEVIAEEVGAARFASGKFDEARALFEKVAIDTDHFVEFSTLPAYETLTSDQAEAGPYRALAY